MKKLFFFFLLNVFGTAFLHATVSAYKIDDSAIEQLFSSATDESAAFAMNAFSANRLEFPSSCIKQKSDDTETVAGIVALASWVAGIGWLIPIHRFILGTGGNDFKIFCTYFVTISGCGFILLIDGIHLLLDDSGTKYIGNTKFIMW